MSTITRQTTNIKVQPDSGITPTYNETIMVLESPNVISDNFKWVIDIIVYDFNSGDWRTISNLELLPNPDGFGVLDVHRHIQNEITSTYYPAETDIGIAARETFKVWKLGVKEVFENPKWVFDDNRTDLGANVGFTTDSSIVSGFSDIPHPFDDGDEVNIVQDPGFTHPEYNATTTLTVVDDLTVTTTIPVESNTPVEGGVMTATGITRTIIQDDFDDLEYVNFNGVLNYDELSNWDSDPYNMEVGSSGDTLTNLPFEADLDIDNHLWVNYYSQININNIIIQTDNGIYIYELPSLTSGKDYIRQAKIGPKDLRDTTQSPGSILTGGLPMIDDDSTFIKYQFYRNLDTVSPLYSINITNECSKYDKYQFLFLDRLGSYIPVNFNLISKKKKTNNKSNYSKDYGRYDSVSNVWGYTTYDRGIATYDIQTNETVTVTSDWLTEAKSDLVQIMMTSPEVYHVDTNGVHRAINITTTSFDVKTTLNDKLINYTISFEYAIKNRNQG